MSFRYQILNERLIHQLRSKNSTINVGEGIINVEEGKKKGERELLSYHISRHHPLVELRGRQQAAPHCGLFERGLFLVGLLCYLGRILIA